VTGDVWLAGCGIDEEAQEHDRLYRSSTRLERERFDTSSSLLLYFDRIHNIQIKGAIVGFVNQARPFGAAA
jgi:hypothetical protein